MNILLVFQLLYLNNKSAKGYSTICFPCTLFVNEPFILYLGLRGFWVGVLGLSSVYPKGINLEKLNFNTIFNKQITKYNFNDFVRKIDKICSSIFSFCFLISFSIVSLFLFLIEILLLSTYADKFFHIY